MDRPRLSVVDPKRFSKRLSKLKKFSSYRYTYDPYDEKWGDEIQLAPVTSTKYLEWDTFDQSAGPPFWTVSHRKSSTSLIKAMKFQEQNQIKDFFSDDEYNDDFVFFDDENTEVAKKKGDRHSEAWRRHSDSPYTLVFYGLRGEAELIRLLFIMSGEPFEERHIVEEEERLQVLESTPYNSLPVLTRGGEIWGHTDAIVRTLARKFFMLGQTNHEHLVVEAMFERLCQLKRNHSQVIQALHLEVKSKEKLEWMYHQLRYLILPPAMAEWEKLILSSKGPFIVASGMTLADVAIMDFLDQCSLKIHLEDVLGDFECLADLIMLVKGHQRIANYLDERSDLEWNI